LNYSVGSSDLVRDRMEMTSTTFSANGRVMRPNGSPRDG
jgi:hypothetical protein